MAARREISAQLPPSTLKIPKTHRRVDRSSEGGRVRGEFIVKSSEFFIAL